MIQIFKNFNKKRQQPSKDYQSSLDNEQGEHLQNEHQQNDTLKLHVDKSIFKIFSVRQRSLIFIIMILMITLVIGIIAFTTKKEKIIRDSSNQLSLKSIGYQNIQRTTQITSKTQKTNTTTSVHNMKKQQRQSISPTIFPFNNVQEANITYTLRGVRAAISNNCLERGRNRLAIVDLNLTQNNEVVDEEREYFRSRYNTDGYKELPFCIVVPTFNNKDNERYIKNIKSIVMQEYLNFHIIIIDDASTDGTAQAIDNYLHSQNQVNQSRYNIVKNKQRMYALYNILYAAENYCEPQQIFLIVDGDDELLGRQVLKLFNAVFSEKELWFVYSNYITTNLQQFGYSQPLPIDAIINNRFRQYEFFTSHLRAYYTQLLLNIKPEDLLDENGQFLKTAYDVAICYPVLQQSRERVGYIPELTYVYTFSTGINNNVGKDQQSKAHEMLMKRPKYSRLPNLFES